MKRIIYSKQDQIRFDEYTKLLDSLEPRVVRAFTDALASVEIEFALVRDLFEQQRFDDILNLIGFDKFEREFQRLVTPELEAIARRGQRWAVDELGDFPGISEVNFAVFSPDVLIALQTQAGVLITNTTRGQQQIVRRYLTDAFRQGRNSASVAREISDVVGLGERQAIAVQNFSRAVDDFFAGDLTANQVRSRFRLSPGLRGNRDAIKARYATRQRLHRGRVIAREETMTGFSQGRKAAWGRMRETGTFTGVEVVEWLTTPDERACPICVPLHGQQIVLGGAWNSNQVGVVELPPAHIQCRCDVRVVLNPENVRISPERREANEFLETRLTELTAP